MIGQIGAWVWFLIAWAFILAVLFKRWHDREHRDQKATEQALKRTRQRVGDDHYQDGA